MAVDPRLFDLRPWDNVPEVWVCRACGRRGEDVTKIRHQEDCQSRPK